MSADHLDTTEHPVRVEADPSRLFCGNHGFRTWLHRASVDTAMGTYVLLAASYGDSISTISLLVTVTGFAVMVWQLVRTANASVKTREAVERTEQRMALNHLLVLLPQFLIVEHELDAAAQEDDSKGAIRVLRSYRKVAHEIAAVLSDQDGVDQDLVARLRSSGDTAGQAKNTLLSRPNAKVVTVAKAVIVEVGDLSSLVSGAVVNFKTSTAEA